ncbi:alpha/beta hydrolase [Streptomyces sp. NPDC086777]|uniref:alpha/beta hydrolase n=1 Tax=Streptomyces sp. NPDC086777 TaxID=3154866 RepID=UPI00344DFE22
MAPHLVFVHGVGKPHDAGEILDRWRRALADGARAAGHGRGADRLLDGTSVDVRLAYYSDLFPRKGSAVASASPEADDENAELAEMLLDAVDERLAGSDDDREAQVLRRARSQLAPEGQAQGPGDLLRRVLAAGNTLLSLPGLRTVGGWTSSALMVSDLRQVRQYLSRGHLDEAQVSLDRRIRAQVHAELDPDAPTVVVAHSLGTVVAFETLHAHPGPVPLFVTLGSPIGMRAAVQRRMRPRPLSAPPGVERWLNFWDRDDFITAWPKIETWVAPNARAAAPVTGRVDSDGLHVHPVVNYLAQPAVAGPVVEALEVAVPA